MHGVATDVEIERTLNAIAVTLDDQALDHMDPERVQEIVDGATGGERRLHVRADGRRAALVDLHGHEVAWARLADGEWTVGRAEAK